jgi:hypothetical protein
VKRSDLAGASRVTHVTVIKVEDVRGAYVVFDGEFIEKLPAQGSSNRQHVSRFKEVLVNHKPAKKKLFGGQTEEHWDVLIKCGTMYGLWVAPAEKPKLDELIAALEATRAAAG